MTLARLIEAERLPQKLKWVLKILHEAHPARVEPESDGMRKAAHWAWSLGLAMRHIELGHPITYSISPSGRAAILRAMDGRDG